MDTQTIDNLLRQLASSLAALHRAGLPVSAVNRPATDRPPLVMIIIDDVNFRDGVFHRPTAQVEFIHVSSEEEE
jgi:hypothetical protein